MGRTKQRGRKAVNSVKPKDVVSQSTNIAINVPLSKNVQKSPQIKQSSTRTSKIRTRSSTQNRLRVNPLAASSSTSGISETDRRAKKLRLRKEKRAEKKAAEAQGPLSESYLNVKPDDALDDFSALDKEIGRIQKEQKKADKAQKWRLRRAEMSASKAVGKASKAQAQTFEETQMADRLDDQMQIKTHVADQERNELHTLNVIGAPLDKDQQEEEEEPYSPKLSPEFIM